MKRVLLAAPLESELSGVLARLRKEELPLEITSLVLGVGPRKPALRLQHFLSRRNSCDLVLVLGLAGALTDDLKTGDLVTPSSVSDGARELPLKAGGGISAVPFVTAGKILKPSEKRELHLKNPSWRAVDMESFFIAEFLAKQRLPFMILRAILDEKDTVFPDFRWIFSNRPFRDLFPFLGFAFCRPAEALRLWEFRRKLKRAQRALGRGAGVLLRKLV